jgi:TonB family protein
VVHSLPPGNGPRRPRGPEDAHMVPGLHPRSRLAPDLRVDGIAVLLACAFHLLLAFLLVPASMRHETSERTAARFALPGPTQYGEIRVKLVPLGDAGGIGPHRLMGAVKDPSDLEFKGKVVAASHRASPRRDKGEGGESIVTSTEGDALQRLRELHGYLPTAQTSDVAARVIAKPEYPEEARVKGIEGLVVVVALVNESGNVEDVALETSVDPLLDQAAMRAAYRTSFYPYLLDGVAQAVFVRMPYRFELVGTLVE